MKFAHLVPEAAAVEESIHVAQRFIEETRSIEAHQLSTAREAA